MKAMIDNGVIINLMPDNYIAGNHVYDDTMVKIKNVGFEAKEKDLIGSAVTEYGTPKYYLEGSTLKAYTQEELEATPEYKLYTDNQKRKQYIDNVDCLTLEHYRKSLLGYSQNELVLIKEKIEKETTKIKGK